MSGGGRRWGDETMAGVDDGRRGPSAPVASTAQVSRSAREAAGPLGGKGTEDRGATSCPCEWVDDTGTGTWGTALVNGTKQSLEVGGEVYDIEPLAGVHGPLPIVDRSILPGAAADAQLALYVGVCSVLVGGHDSRTTSSVFHHPQSAAHVAREGDYPQVATSFLSV